MNNLLHVSTPSFYKVFSSSMTVCKYTSILDFRLCGLGITNYKNMYGCIMHVFGGKLCTQTTIGHANYGLAAFDYGKKPSAHKPRCT